MQNRLSEKGELPSFYYYYKVPDSLSLIQIETFTLLPDKITATHYHNCMEIGWCTQGSGICYFENQIIPFEKGDIQIILPYERHISKSDEEHLCTWHYASFEPCKVLHACGFSNLDFFNNLLQNKITISGIFHPDEYPAITELVLSIIEELLNGATYHVELCSAYLSALLILLARKSKNRTILRPRSDPFLERIVPCFNFIRREWENVSVEKMAQICGLSLSHFRRIFKQVTGMPPKSFLLLQQLQQADYLLVHTEKTILEISAEVGFQNISCFNRLFQKHHTMSPTAYRKKYSNPSKK